MRALPNAVLTLVALQISMHLPFEISEICSFFVPDFVVSQNDSCQR